MAFSATERPSWNPCLKTVVDSTVLVLEGGPDKHSVPALRNDTARQVAHRVALA
ncbi:hypothetical protein AURDEDRAFT_165766 [Auricularia subglabra TFB-10046 SS5]|nr:hypothetical protein AURDEDRAFT_165766 [Auricularia subglabra TFB-10046 SS5]